MRDSVFSGFFKDSIWTLLGLNKLSRIPGRFSWDSIWITGFYWDSLKKGSDYIGII